MNCPSIRRPWRRRILAAKRRATLPESYKDLTAAERNVTVLEITSDLGHMEIVTSGKVLPVVLHRSPLRTLKVAPKITKPRRRIPGVSTRRLSDPSGSSFCPRRVTAWA